MATARNHFMQADSIGASHLIMRCVRRAFLQGFDEYSGKDYQHRKFWVIDKIKLLLEAYAIDLASFANMDNHYHLVARNRPDLLKNLTPLQIATSIETTINTSGFVRYQAEKSKNNLLNADE